jgi:hypothetical protein
MIISSQLISLGMQKQPERTEISVEIDGKRYSGSYSVSSGAVTVDSVHGGRKSTHVGASAEATARMLLREILQAAKDRGELKNRS